MRFRSDVMGVCLDSAVAAGALFVSPPACPRADSRKWLVLITREVYSAEIA